MKNKNLLLLFFLILNQTLIFGQEVEKLKFIKEEIIEYENFNPYSSLLDHNGNLVTHFSFSYSESGPMVEFNIDDVSFKLERFLRATVNTKINRLYTFGKSPLPSDCGSSPCPIRGFRIYDLTGNLIKTDSTVFTLTRIPFYEISESGNLYIAGKSPTSDTLLVQKYNLNGTLHWERRLPLAKGSPRINIKNSGNETITVYESRFYGFSNTIVYFFDGESGQLIWKKVIPRHSRMILFNKNDIVMDYSGLHCTHFSVEQDSSFIINAFFSQSPQMLTSDKTGKLFGGIIRTNSKTEIPFVLYKKVNGKYVLFKKLDLAKYNFTRDSSNHIKPYCLVSIDSTGKVAFSYSNKKLIFR